MTEGSNKLSHIDFDQEIEFTAVAGAVAVQKLIADRNRLREELTASLTAQAELKRRLGRCTSSMSNLQRAWLRVCNTSTAQCERPWQAELTSLKALRPNRSSMATESP